MGHRPTLLMTSYMTSLGMMIVSFTMLIEKVGSGYTNGCWMSEKSVEFVTTPSLLTSDLKFRYNILQHLLTLSKIE